MIDHAADLPTIAEVAKAVGTSVRTLSGTFKAFRGYPPSTFLREQRLKGAHGSLRAARQGESVASIASEWGYINLGEFARSYRQRFGELPSETLRQRT
jgi:transcriptional regulator GlxA family with amidase domain